MTAPSPSSPDPAAPPPSERIGSDAAPPHAVPAAVPSGSLPTYSKGWAIAVLVGLLALLPLAYLGLRQIRLKNDVASWLPKDDPNKITLDWFHAHFEPRDRMLVSWETSSLDDPRIAAFAAEVITREGIDDAVTPTDLLERMEGNKIPRDEAISRLEGVLIGTGLLKIRLTDEGRRRRDALLADLRRRADEARADGTFDVPLTLSPAPDLPDSVPDEARYDIQISWPGIQPGSERAETIADWVRGIAAGGNADARVPLVDDVFFRSGAPIAVSLTVGEGSEGRLRATIESVREAAEAVGIPRDELRMGGSPVAGAGLNDNVIKAAWNPDAPLWNLPRRSPVGTSLLVGVVLAFLMLRSARLAVLVLLVAVYTTVITLALVPPTGGSMSMVLVVMPSLLMVLTMSGAIHVANYWRHAAHQIRHETADGSVPTGSAVLRAARQAAAPCAMASLTTGIGLASLMTSPLVPVRDFGLYSAIGCVLSLGMVLVAFPALLRLWPGRVAGEVHADRDRWGRIGRWINAHGTIVAIACFAIMLAGAAGLHKFRTETKVIRYFPADARIVQDYEFLENNLAGIVPVTTVVGFQGEGWGNADVHDQLELIRRIEQNLAAHEEISGTLALPDFLPPIDPEMSRFRLTRFKREIFDAVREQVESAADAGEDVGIGVEGEEEAGESDASEFVTRVRVPLAGEVDGGGDTRHSVRFDPFEAGDGESRPPMGRELYKITAQVSILTELDYGPFLEQVDRIVRETIAEWEAEFAGDDADGDEDGADAAERRVEYVVTGTVPLFLRTQEAVLESLIRSFGLAFAVIAVVMIGILRSVVAGLITMIPNLLPVGLVFGLVSWAEVPVDIGTMITASVALGVAVDGTLHLLTWFRERLGRGESAGAAIGAGLSHCGPAMFQTSTVVALGLLCLMFSDLLLISRFGWLMAALITAALFADLVFLPSLLSGTLGKVIERRVHPDEPAAVPESPVESAESDAA